MREWKPGDVALVELPADGCPHWHEGGPVAAVRYRYGWALLRDTDWFYDETDGRHEFKARPLVVIDPEDREQVAGLVGAWVDKGAHLQVGVPRMQLALREFTNPTPPKPDEPTGLGAVVEEAEGTKWMRGSSMRGLKAWVNDEALDSEWRTYADIAAVRVLSEGVQ